VDYQSNLRGINNLDKPVQNFHRTLHQAVKWAEELLEKHPATADNPDPRVEIFEVLPELVKTVRAGQKKCFETRDRSVIKDD
jgi:hypothetical protein